MTKNDTLMQVVALSAMAAAVAAALHQPVEAEAGQLLGHGRLRHVHDLADLGDGLLAFRQQAEDEQAAFMRERLHQLAGLAGLGNQLLALLAGGGGEIEERHGRAFEICVFVKHRF